MSDRLFVYGTLLFDEVWSYIVGHTAIKHNATVFDWARYYMRDKVYPGMKVEPGGIVQGALIMNLCSQDWRRLDRFEDKLYRKKQITVYDANNMHVDAYSYVIEENYTACLSKRLWSPSEFKENHFDDFLTELKKRY